MIQETPNGQESMNGIEKVDEDIWIVEGDNVNFYGFCYPTRSVIVRFRDGKLWVWSPIKLTPSVRKQVECLGEVSYLVSPNKIHHLYLQDWAEAYPEASIWGPRSTALKRKDLTFEGQLTDIVPEPWSEELDQVWFNGSFALDEIVFFHRRSRTVILADLSENFSDEFLRANWRPWQRKLAAFWGIVEGRGYAPLEWRMSFFNRRATRQARDRVLSWQPDKVIMAHGTWKDSSAQAFLEKSFSWI